MKCRVCGKEFEKSLYIEPHEDICSDDCFDKDFWDDIVKEKARHVFIDGVAYAIGDPLSEDDIETYFRGFGGSEFTIERLDTKERIVTRNLWERGEIPASHKELLPNNAVFIKGDIKEFDLKF